MRKRITLSLLVLVLCFSSVLTSCGMLAFIDKSVIEQNDAPSSVSTFESENDPIPDDKKLAPSGSGDVSEPLFWKVSGNGYEGDFFLLGSIHSGLKIRIFIPTKSTTHTIHAPISRSNPM